MENSIVILIVLGIILALIVVIYNRLVRLRNQFKNAFAQIDVQLKRRYDLVPNLVEVAKKYMQHERETLEAVIAARHQAARAAREASNDPGNIQAIEGLITAENALTGSLGRLFALAEAYPDLKANQNMMQLTEELSSTENRIAFARQAFNDAVMTYNTSRDLFPAIMFAGLFGFSPARFLEIENNLQRQAPKVSF